MTVIKKEQKKVEAKLKKWIKSDPRRIRILAELMVAIPLSRSVQGNDLAANIIRQVQDQSIQQMLRRFYKNEAITWEVFYAPLVREVLKSLKVGLYYLVMDTTKVGAKHRAVTLSLAYKNRSLPLVWQIEPGCKGHSKEKVQVELLKKIYPYLPQCKPVIFLGDSEFDGVLVQRQLRQQGWFYVIRTAPKYYIYADKEAPGVCLASLVPQVNAPAQTRQQVYFTTKHQFGPVDCFACWEDPYDEPLVLIAHLPQTWPFSIRNTYDPRFWTEPLFGDCKEAGFRLSETRLTLPERLSRLFLAVSASYLWMFWLGSQVIIHKQLAQVDRSNRRTLSVFKLGWRWFKQQLKFGLLVPFSLDFSDSFVLPSLKFT